MSGPMGFGMPIGGAALPAGIVVLGAAGQGSVGEIVTSDPSTGSGLKRSPGTVVAKSDGSAVWLKTGTANTAWALVPGFADLDEVAIAKRNMLALLGLTSSQVGTWVETFNDYSTAGDTTTFGSRWIRTVGVNSHVDHLITGGAVAGGVLRILKDNTVNTWEENSLLFNGPGFPAALRSWAVNFRAEFIKLSTATDANNNLLLGMAQGSTGTLAGLVAGLVIFVGYAGGTSTAFVDVTASGAGNNVTAYSLATLDSVWRDITIVGINAGGTTTKVQVFIDGTKIFEAAAVPNVFGPCNPFAYCNRGQLNVDTVIVMWERER